MREKINSSFMLSKNFENIKNLNLTKINNIKLTSMDS